MNRRDLLVSLFAVFATSLTGRASAQQDLSLDDSTGNFDYIYSNSELRHAFLDFLTNVFHLYPEDEFHDLLTRLAKPGTSDREIYEALQAALPEIKPLLGSFRYALPALKKQKAIMADQTVMLLDPFSRYDGHLEIGSTGRYVGALDKRLDITGDVFLLHTKEGGYGPEDLVERGQIRKIGTHIDMGNYSTEFANVIPPNSLDLVTVYIGFHHCPVEKRQEFISAVCDVIRPGGTLILRDHDVSDEDSWRMAALAHDTFNAGIDESWQFNNDELRHFYSLQFIVKFIEDIGMKHNGQFHFQRGDPTRNGLTAFAKT